MDRLQILTRSFDNLTAASAAKILDLSPRQCSVSRRDFGNLDLKV
ncbi:MAG: hypothetical protein ABIK39_02565 [candidate division WOR-3 bacterium]